MSLEQIFQTICLNLSKLYPKYCWSLFSRHGVYSGEYLNHLSRLLILLSVQCYASTEYNFTCVCVCVSVCPSHFLSTRLQVRPLNEFFTVDSLEDVDLLKAFWGSQWWIITFRGSKFPKTPILGASIGISSQNCANNSSSYIFRSMCQIDTKFDGQLHAASSRDFVGGLVWW